MRSISNPFTGKTCPFCQFLIKADSEAVECPSCKVPHHRECWEQNGGCTTFGCGDMSSDRPSSYQSSRNIIEIDLDVDEESLVESKSPKSFTSHGMESANLPFYRRFIGFRTLTPWKTFVGGAFYLVSFSAPIVTYMLYIDGNFDPIYPIGRSIYMVIIACFSVYLASSVAENRNYMIYLSMYFVYFIISAGLLYSAIILGHYYSDILLGFVALALIDSLWFGSWLFGVACILFGIINKRTAGFFIGILYCVLVASLLAALIGYLLSIELNI